VIRTLLSICLIAASAWAGPQAPRIAWTVETSAPAERRLDLRYGETLDLECRFLSYQTPMDILGATVTLHARTNGMAEGYSYQAAGVAASNGLATVRLAVDAWLPRGLAAVPYALEVAQSNGVRLLRATGTVCLTGTASASSADPVPVWWVSNLIARIDSAIDAIPAPTGVPVWIGTNNLEFATIEPGPVFSAWRRTASGWVLEEPESIDAGMLPMPLSTGVYGSWDIGINPDETWHIYYADDWRLNSLNTLSVTNFSMSAVSDQRIVNLHYRFSSTNFVNTLLTAAALSNLVSSATLADFTNGINERLQGLATLDEVQGLLNNSYYSKSQADARYPRITGGTLTNATLAGPTTLRNVAPTNLISRLYFSNDVLYSEHVIP
jgi:hypothetical protein